MCGRRFRSYDWWLCCWAVSSGLPAEKANDARAPATRDPLPACQGPYVSQQGLALLLQLSMLLHWPTANCSRGTSWTPTPLQMIDALMPAKRRLVGATPAARAHAAASAASAFAHKPRSDSRSSLMAKPGGQLKLLKELG